MIWERGRARHGILCRSSSKMNQSEEWKSEMKSLTPSHPIIPNPLKICFLRDSCTSIKITNFRVRMTCIILQHPAACYMIGSMKSNHEPQHFITWSKAQSEMQEKKLKGQSKLICCVYELAFTADSLVSNQLLLHQALFWRWFWQCNAMVKSTYLEGALPHISVESRLHLEKKPGIPRGRKDPFTNFWGTPELHFWAGWCWLDLESQKTVLSEWQKNPPINQYKFRTYLNIPIVVDKTILCQSIGMHCACSDKIPSEQHQKPQSLAIIFLTFPQLLPVRYPFHCWYPISW